MYAVMETEICKDLSAPKHPKLDLHTVNQLGQECLLYSETDCMRFNSKLQKILDALVDTIEIP